MKISADELLKMNFLMIESMRVEGDTIGIINIKDAPEIHDGFIKEGINVEAYPLAVMRIFSDGYTDSEVFAVANEAQASQTAFNLLKHYGED